jgi:uncharacterized membrane protein
MTTQTGGEKNMNKKNTEQLLLAGIIAGPFYFIVSLLLAITREGFDPIRHPASLLSLGEGGWMQIMTFVMTGIMYIASAVGLRQILKGIGARWVSRLFALVGLAFIAGGIFTADPGLGFPPGAPQGAAKEMSWHGMLHGFAPILGFLALFIALMILARRFGSQGEKIWSWITIIVAITTFVLSAMPSFTGNWEAGEFNFIPLWIGVALGYGYTSLIMMRLKKEGIKGK